MPLVITNDLQLSSFDGSFRGRGGSFPQPSGAGFRFEDNLGGGFFALESNLRSDALDFLTLEDNFDV